MSDPDQSDPRLAELELIYAGVESTEPKPSDGPIADEEAMRAAQRAANDLELPDIPMLEDAAGFERSESTESPGSSSSLTHRSVMEQDDFPREQTDKNDISREAPAGGSAEPTPSLSPIAPLGTEDIAFVVRMADGENKEDVDFPTPSLRKRHHTGPKAADPDYKAVEGASSSDTPASIDVKAPDKLVETVAEEAISSIVPPTSEERFLAERPRDRIAATDGTVDDDDDEEEKLDGCIEKLSTLQICVENDDLRGWTDSVVIPEKSYRSPENKTLVKEFGLPAAGALFQDDNYVLCYDRGRRVPFWVARYVKKDHLKGYAAYCLALYGDGNKLYWSDFDRKELRVIDLNTGKDELVVDNVRIGGMAVDQEGGYVYFAHKAVGEIDRSGGTVDRVKLDGTEQIKISSGAALCPAILPVTGSGLSEPCLLAGQDGGIARIHMAKSDMVKVLKTPRTEVLALAFDPEARIVFYSTKPRGDDQMIPQIRRCALTGNNGHAENDTLVISDVYTHGLAVDYEMKQLYWTDNNSSSIMLTDYDGSSRGVANSFQAEDPGSIVVDTKRRRIYWTERGTGNVECASLSLGGRAKTWTLRRGTASRHLKGVVRFHEDEEVPEQFRQRKKNYKKVCERYNLTKGHIVRAGDCVWNQNVLNRTFRLSQVFPQNADLNSGLYNELEDKIAQIVKVHGAAIVVAVTIFLPASHKPCIRCDPYPKDTKYHTGADGPCVPYEDFWVRNRVLADSTAYTDSAHPPRFTPYVHGPHVPTHIATIVLAINSSGKLSESGRGEPVAVGAYQFPNTSPIHTDLSHYKRTVKHIEENTGLVFFGKLKEKGVDVDKDLPDVDTNLNAWNNKNKKEASSPRTQT